MFKPLLGAIITYAIFGLLHFLDDLLVIFWYWQIINHSGTLRGVKRHF
jgi:hypothetical protein